MKKLLILTMLCLLALGCDDMQKPMMDVLGDPMPIGDPTTDVSIQEIHPQIPEITIENVLDLAPGQYRFRPIGISFKSVDGDNVITSFQGGTVHPAVVLRDLGHGGNMGRFKGYNFELGTQHEIQSFGGVEKFPLDPPRIFLYINLNPQPYELLLDGRQVMEYDPVFDEIIIEIVRKIDEGQDQGGRRGSKYTYNYVGYEGIAIANFTHPDRGFEYE